MAETVICVDVSHYQQGFDCAAFRKGGGLGVILKATEGTSIKDDCYKSFRQQAQAAGLAVASYHFFRPSDPAQQAQHYLDFADPDPGERVVCDFEDPATSVDDMVAFLIAIEEINPSLQLSVYSGHLIKERLGSERHDYLAEHTSLWLAQYTSGEPSWPTNTWKRWSLWQYTDTGRVPGFDGNIDCNRFNGSHRNFLKWMGPAALEVDVETLADVVEIRVAPGTRVTVNGKEIIAS